MKIKSALVTERKVTEAEVECPYCGEILILEGEDDEWSCNSCGKQFKLEWGKQFKLEWPKLLKNLGTETKELKSVIIEFDDESLLQLDLGDKITIKTKLADELIEVHGRIRGMEGK